jgi:hypothetical protein
MTKTKQSGHEKLRKALESGAKIDLNNLPIDPADDALWYPKDRQQKDLQEKKPENSQS